MTAPEITPLGTCERTGGPTHYGWHPRMATCLRWTQTLPAPTGTPASGNTQTCRVCGGINAAYTDLPNGPHCLSCYGLTPVSAILPSVLGAIARGEG